MAAVTSSAEANIATKRHRQSTLTQFDGETPGEPTTPNKEGVADLLAKLERPWRNREVLEYYYDSQGYSTNEIAAKVFDDEVCSETVRQWLHKNDIMSDEKRDTKEPTRLRDKLLALDPDEVGTPRPEGDDTYRKYRGQNRDETEGDGDE